ncbi:MAG: VWA domain-containing protein [Thermoanaerobaculia bacterium]|nr:VWA domain-containing protein [Thermoanaerobaculia bacterium]
MNQLQLYTRRSAMLVLLALTFSAVATAQTEAETPRFEGMVEVSEVLLDVLVTDRKGNVVVGLGPEDFLVTEDGEEVPLRGVSFYSNRYLVQEREEVTERRLSGPAENEILADRYFIFFFQDQQRTGGVVGSRLLRQQLDAARQAKRWIEEEMLGGDWVAVVSYDVKLHVHSDFSRDRSVLLRAVEDAARSKNADNQWASRRPDAATLGDRPTLLTSLPQGKELSKQTRRMYDAFELIGEATREILGRKNVMFFANGFGNLERVAGRGIDGITARPDQRYWPEMVESLNDNNVAVYPIDLSPSYTDHPQADFLSHLADTTGGKYYENFVSFLTPMRQIADEANGYYLLSYPASHPADQSGYREVEVTTVNPEFKVRARQGYRYGV